MSGEPSSKKAKIEIIGQVSDSNTNQMAVAVPAPPVAQGKRCEIFKLDVDCCEEIFEWLSIEDLLSFGQTCKRMNRIAGMYFVQNYANAEFYSESDGIYYNSTPVNGFSEFIEIINVHFITKFARNDEIITNQLKYIGTNCKSLREIKFSHLNSGISMELQLIRDVLAHVERITTNGKYPDENIFDLCPNLTHLTVRWDDTAWLYKLHKCPRLEYLSLIWLNQVVVVQEFFKQIENIRSIEVNWQFILANKHGLLSTNAKLENLIISWRGSDGNEQLICDILNKLFERGFYKRLHIVNIGFINQKQINQMVSLRALETLSFFGVESANDAIFWPLMASVKKLAIHSWDHIDLNTVASKLPNLKSICLRDNSVDFILPFLRKSKLLSSIIMWYKFDRPNESLDLSALNKQRQPLIGARKVFIHIPEDVFLDTKFTIGASRNLVEIKREQSTKLTQWEYWLID